MSEQVGMSEQSDIARKSITLEKREIVSEEQTNPPTDSSTTAVAASSTAVTAEGKAENAGNSEHTRRPEKAEKVVRVKMLGPRKLSKEQMEAPEARSLWPFVLAVTIFITCVGLLIHPIIFFIGVVLILGSITGWLLERRSYLR